MNDQITKFTKSRTNWQLVTGNWKPQGGYTLIEILVVLTIIGLFFSIGYASFRDFSRRQALSGVVKNIQGDLRIAQEDAITGQKPPPPTGECNVGKTLNNYSFSVASSHSEYTVTANCIAGGWHSVTVKDVNLPSGMSITIAPSADNPIIFNVLGRGNNIEEGVDAVITVTQAITNNTAYVTVTSGGEIK